jgi:SAM-dependent methyltransferase
MSRPALNLSEEFRQRGPWITRFIIDGQVLGGDYDGNNWRTTAFLELYPDAKNILELGALEGGQSLAIASRRHVRRVVAVEGRESNLDRAKFVQSLVPHGSKVEFVHADLDHADLTADLIHVGRFDAVLCCGILYHLTEPLALLRQCAGLSPHLFLWTHYCERAETTVAGIEGSWHNEAGAADPLSGLSARSFWPTKPALFEMLSEAGYGPVSLVREIPDHQHGPAIAMTAIVPGD